MKTLSQGSRCPGEFRTEHLPHASAESCVTSGPTYSACLSAGMLAARCYITLNPSGCGSEKQNRYNKCLVQRIILFNLLAAGSGSLSRSTSVLLLKTTFLELQRLLQQASDGLMQNLMEPSRRCIPFCKMIILTFYHALIKGSCHVTSKKTWNCNCQ